MGCLLNIYGKSLDIDALEKQIRIGKVEKTYKDSNAEDAMGGCFCLTKYIRGTNYKRITDQSEAVLQFLNRHKRKLRSIVNHPDIETAILNFELDSTPRTRANFAQSMYLPRELIQLCVELHIEIEITMFHTRPIGRFYE